MLALLGLNRHAGIHLAARAVHAPFMGGIERLVSTLIIWRVMSRLCHFMDLFCQLLLMLAESGADATSKASTSVGVGARDDSGGLGLCL